MVILIGLETFFSLKESDLKKISGSWVICKNLWKNVKNPALQETL